MKLGKLQWMIEGPGLRIWLNSGVVPPPTSAVYLRCITALGRRPVYVNGRICFGSADLRAWGTTSPLKLEEP